MQALPDDLLQEIFQQVDPKGLQALTLMNKNVRRLALQYATRVCITWLEDSTAALVTRQLSLLPALEHLRVDVRCLASLPDLLAIPGCAAVLGAIRLNMDTELPNAQRALLETGLQAAASVTSLKLYNHNSQRDLPLLQFWPGLRCLTLARPTTDYFLPLALCPTGLLVRIARPCFLLKTPLAPRAAPL